MSLTLDFFHAPDLVAVDDEVPEFVSAVEPGSCPVVLVGAEYDDGPVVEGQREGVDVGGVQREADEQDAVLFEYLGNVRYWAAGHAERSPHLPGRFFEFAAGSLQAGDGYLRHRDRRQLGCVGGHRQHSGLLGGIQPRAP